MICLKLCYKSENDIFVHSDGTISKCCTAWIIKNLPTTTIQEAIEQCSIICDTKCNFVESINILLGYKCMPNCSMCTDNKIFQNVDIIKKVDLEKIIASIQNIISYTKTVTTIQIGSFFDSSSHIYIHTLAELINKIVDDFDNLNLKIYHTGITPLYELEKILSPKAIKRCIFIINFNGTKCVHDLYKPNSFDCIYNNILNNKNLKIEINCVIFESSIDYLNEIFLNLDAIDRFVERYEIKLDNAKDRINKHTIVQSLAFIKLFYMKNKNKIISKNLKQAIEQFINDNGQKSKFKLKLRNELMTKEKL